MTHAVVAPGGARQDTLQHLYQLFYGDLGLCGCGNPEDAWQLIADILNRAPLYNNPDTVRELIGQPGAYHLVLSALTHADLIEHGSSIGGSWITPKGEWYRKAFAGITDWEALNEAVSGAGFPHDAEGCTDACWEVQR